MSRQRSRGCHVMLAALRALAEVAMWQTSPDDWNCGRFDAEPQAHVRTSIDMPTRSAA
jgi:hypothetical protein